MRHDSLSAGLVMSALVALQTTLFAADPATQQAIKQAEEGRRDTTRMLHTHPTHPMHYPWWGWSPYGYPLSSGPPYPGVTGAPYLPGPQQPASPYPMPVNPAGRVLLLVNPLDAEVYVDGVRLQQQADLSYEIGLLAGPHRVEVRRDGYKPYSQQLEIVPGSALYLPIGLEK